MRSSSRVCVICVLWVANSLAASAQTFKTVVSFNGSDGANPQDVTLAQGRDGNLWGTTGNGGVALGNAFSMTPGGILNRLSRFDFTHGSFPNAGLVLGKDNYLYGTTVYGGSNNAGVVFKLAPTGTLTVLFNFDGTHGGGPAGALTQGTDGNFYGTTKYGGSSTNCEGGCGTVFEITPSGTLTTLHNFGGGGTDGAFPAAGLVQATDGNFYGTTESGGSSTNCGLFQGCGTVFRITPAGTLTVIHSFSLSDGANPTAGLVERSAPPGSPPDGYLYGTTNGTSGTDCVGGSSCGTVFRITRGGTLTTLYNFSSFNGVWLHSTLAEGTDGNFYGTSSGLFSSGTLFQITPSGALTTLHNFGGTDGEQPIGGLVQHTSGLFYGTTEFGGAFINGTDGCCGTVFSLDMGLGPFIKTTTTLGEVGSRVQILGTGLTGATSVSFNGTPATTFAVDADTYMTAIIPAGATTGRVQVTTPTGTLRSNVNFRIAP